MFRFPNPEKSFESQLEFMCDCANRDVNISILSNILSAKTGNDYSFLSENDHLGDMICLIGLGGSHAYGTNVPESDLDIRGIAVNHPYDLLTNSNFEQVCDSTTDTTIYSFNKMISLLSQCNPNTIEILGLKPDHYLYLDEIGQKLLDNKHLFVSKKCINTFGGYAYAQLRRLDNKAARTVEQDRQEKHILHSIETASTTFPEKYFTYSEDQIKLYVDESDRDDMDSEIYMDICLKHYPLRDWKGMWSEMNNIVKDYAKLGHRNKNAIARGKLGKHQTHLLRLMAMCTDMLETGEIITFREKDHDLLMDIRNGKYLDEDDQPTKEFEELVTEYQHKMDEAAKNTKIPDKPDYKAIARLQYDINKEIVEKYG